MIEVWQAEWCPYSHDVRQALTELGVSYVCHQAAADREFRDEMEQAIGSRTIPVVRLDDGTVLDDDAEVIVAELRRRFGDPPGADAHRRQAAAHGS